MPKTIGLTELRQRLRAILQEVAQERTSLVVTRDSRPEAVLIPYADFLRYQALEERRVLAEFDRLVERLSVRNAGFSDEEIEADVEAARTELAP